MYLLQQLANALPVAALYAVLAFGYAIAFGVTRRVDLTYGALFAFAGQIFVLFADVGWNRLWLVLPACLALGAACSLAYTAGAGLLVGRVVMARLLRASPNAVIVAGLGVSLVLMRRHGLPRRRAASGCRRSSTRRSRSGRRGPPMSASR